MPDEQLGGVRKSSIWPAVSPSKAMTFKGSIDCSTSPLFPAAVQGDMWSVSRGGRIGGPAGPMVEQGDAIVCNKDTRSGPAAVVRDRWVVVKKTTTVPLTTSPTASQAITSPQPVARRSNHTGSMALDINAGSPTAQELRDENRILKKAIVKLIARGFPDTNRTVAVPINDEELLYDDSDVTLEVHRSLERAQTTLIIRRRVGNVVPDDDTKPNINRANVKRRRKIAEELWPDAQTIHPPASAP